MKHRVKAKMKEVSVSNTGSAIELAAYGDEKKLGTIKLGKGTFRWKAKHEHSTNFKRMSWEQFFSFLKDHEDEFDKD